MNQSFQREFIIKPMSQDGVNGVFTPVEKMQSVLYQFKKNNGTANFGDFGQSCSRSSKKKILRISVSEVGEKH